MGLAELADHPAVVLCTYLFVFLPWAAFQAFDFISDTWKTVNSTRADGRLQFKITICLIAVVSFYIVLQMKAGDYKELSVAVVVLLFAFQHLVRTWWGLWQLEHFRSWAERSIRCFESYGFEYDIGDEKDKPKEGDSMEMYKWKAGLIKVNQSIIDNQVWHADTKCYMEDGNGHTFMYMAPEVKHHWNSSFIIFVEGCWVILQHIFSSFYSSKNRTRQVPYEPIEVWIRWAVPFAAQGMRTWIDGFNVICDPGPGDYVSFEGYEGRREYYAREVLASVILLFPEMGRDRGTSHFRVGHPLQWHRDGKRNERGLDTFHGLGKVSKMKLLQKAIISGKGLPFDTPHLVKPHENNLEGNLVLTPEEEVWRHGYKSFEHDLRQVCLSMPAKFGNSINQFNVEQLEWLTILLNLGESEKNELRDESHSVVDILEMGDDGIPVRMLKSQLGVADELQMVLKEFDRGCGAQFKNVAFPIMGRGLGGLRGKNRNVLRVCGMIDNWKALNTGCYMKFVVDQESEWESACLAACERDKDVFQRKVEIET